MRGRGSGEEYFYPNSTLSFIPRSASLFYTAGMMKQFLAFTALSAFTLALGVLAFSPAFAGPVNPVLDAATTLAQPADADCYAIGEDVATQNGGTVAKAVPVTQDGQAMCKVVVLIPGKDGERAKRQEFVVPQ